MPTFQLRGIATATLAAQLLVQSVDAAVLLDRPASTTSAMVLTSATGTPSVALYQQRTWEAFSFTTAQTIREVRWRGSYQSLPPTGFYVAFFTRPPAGIPDIVAQPLAYYFTNGNAFEKPAGTVAGVPMYDYRLSLPTPFVAGANHTYAITILAYQPGLPDWGRQISSTSGSHSVFRGATSYMTDSNLGGGAGTGTLSFHDVVSNPDIDVALSRSPSAGGTVTGAGNFAPGAAVTVTATPAAGFTFLYWKDGPNIVAKTPALSFTAERYRSLVAHFSGANHARLNITWWPPIGGKVNQGGTFTKGTTVDLVAEPLEGFFFDSWQGGPGGTSLETSFVLNADTHVEALFYPTLTPPYAIVRTSATPAAGGVLTGEGAFGGYGQNVRLQAVPNPGYEFTGWSAFGYANANPIVSYPASLGNSYVTANFRPVASLARTPGAVTLSWPSTATGWTMQQNSNLSTAGWSTLSLPFTTLDDTNTVQVPGSLQRMFFRIKGP
jgi:Divergent InlB B-repeat domain